VHGWPRTTNTHPKRSSNCLTRCDIAEGVTLSVRAARSKLPGLRAVRRAFQPQALRAAGGARVSLRGAVAQAAAFTFLNPHVYLDTVLLMGSIGARQPADARLWFVGGAALASGAWFAALGFGARLLAPLFSRPRAWQVLDVLVGATMLALAAGLVHQTLGG
jgi:L-lysine exporter family protein LysE/ArgO